MRITQLIAFGLLVLCALSTTNASFDHNVAITMTRISALGYVKNNNDGPVLSDFVIDDHQSNMYCVVGMPLC